ncbi:MmgE/PrpD family protein [Mycobacterium sp. smrl_JER01]|uniref:MmgE/PrpD family protein n=1 Tax=Mycobacterium sp. smrl_JER01 TaxID=3402633 RepID=UPI003AC1F721
MTTTSESGVHAYRRVADMTEHDLVWEIADVAADPVAVPAETHSMVINRLIDNAAISAASVGRRLVVIARAQARAHRATPGASVFGIDGSFSPEWAAFANGVAVHDLEFHDAFLAGHHAHPAGTIPALVAVAQQTGLRGTDLIRGIATSYEVQIRLAQGRPPQHATHDNGAYLGVALAAGLGTMLRLRPDTIRAAIGHAAYLTSLSRQAPELCPSPWRFHTAAYIGRLAIEAVDRAMRGDGPPAPTRDARNSPDAGRLEAFWPADHVDLPDRGEPKRAIMDSYPRQHAACYFGQAPIDLAVRMHGHIGDVNDIESVVLHTSRHDRGLIGSGAGDPNTVNPDAPRHVLSQSLTYLFAVALQDGAWHHERSYASERAHRPDTLELWRKITLTAPGGIVSQGPVGAEARFAIRAEITLRGGAPIVDELAAADAHPAGARPFGRNDYVAKFTELAEGVIDRREQQRFLDVAMCLNDLKRGSLGMLNPLVDNRILAEQSPITYGIFR